MERGYRLPYPKPSPPDNAIFGGYLDGCAASRVADGIPPFRQIHGCRNFCRVRFDVAARDKNIDSVGGNNVGRSYGVAYTPYSGKSSVLQYVDSVKQERVVIGSHNRKQARGYS